MSAFGRLCLISSVITGALLPGLAMAAPPRVVVLPFSGPACGLAREGVLSTLLPAVRQVSSLTFTEVADTLDASGGTGKWLAAACKKVGCDAVVLGATSRSRRRYRLVVTVYSGVNGELLAGLKSQVRRRRSLRRAGRALARRVLGLLRAQSRPMVADGGGAPVLVPGPDAPVPMDHAVPSPQGQGDATSPGSSVAGAAQHAGGSQPAPASADGLVQPRPKSGAADAALAGGGQPDQGDGDADDAEEGAEPPAKPSLVELSVGVGVAMRDFLLHGDKDDQSTDKTGEGVYPEITLRADVFPLVPWLKGAASGVGLGVTYARHLTIDVGLDDANGDPVQALSQELLLDLEWRWLITDAPTSPWLALAVGWGMRDFELSQNRLLTSLNYRFVRFALDGAVPLGTPLLALAAGLDVRPLLSAGPEPIDSYGKRSGGMGFAVRAGLRGAAALSAGRLFYFASFQYLRMTAEFDGLDLDQVRPEEPRDRSDPSTATDSFIRVWAGLGYGY